MKRGAHSNAMKRKIPYYTPIMPLTLSADADELREKWQTILLVRDEVLKKLEEKRTAGEIHSSLEAEGVTYYSMKKTTAVKRTRRRTTPPLYRLWCPSCTQRNNENQIQVNVAEGGKCARCWHRENSVGNDNEHPEICTRCIAALAVVFFVSNVNFGFQ